MCKGICLIFHQSAGKNAEQKLERREHQKFKQKTFWWVRKSKKFWWVRKSKNLLVGEIKDKDAKVEDEPSNADDKEVATC